MTVHLTWQINSEGQESGFRVEMKAPSSAEFAFQFNVPAGQNFADVPVVAPFANGLYKFRVFTIGHDQALFGPAETELVLLQPPSNLAAAAVN